MQLEHFLALIPLLVLFIISLIFNRIGILHLINVAYCTILAFFALTGFGDTPPISNWELLFFPLTLGLGVISLILFINCMLNGDWI